jgi:2',3'-cyclic-nucleotide 2'-phosphodiesterase (5'-nucleotidase family)
MNIAYIHPSKSKQFKIKLLLPLLLLAGCSAPHHYIASYHPQLYTVDTIQGKDSAMHNMLAPYKQKEAAAMDEVIGYTDAPMSKAQPECTLGYLIADAQLVYAQRKDPDVKISISNQGGIRIPYLNAGPITKGKVYEIMPFDNKLIIAELSGEVLKQFCDHIAAYGGWPVSGITFKIKSKKAVDILVNGQQVNDQLIYKVATSDYIINGGDDCDFLAHCRRVQYNVFIRDMMIAYIQGLNSKGEKLHIQLQKRISYAD